MSFIRTMFHNLEDICEKSGSRIEYRERVKGEYSVIIHLPEKYDVVRDVESVQQTIKHYQAFTSILPEIEVISRRCEDEEYKLIKKK